MVLLTFSIFIRPADLLPAWRRDEKSFIRENLNRTAISRKRLIESNQKGAVQQKERWRFAWWWSRRTDGDRSTGKDRLCPPFLPRGQEESTAVVHGVRNGKVTRLKRIDTRPAMVAGTVAVDMID